MPERRRGKPYPNLLSPPILRTVLAKVQSDAISPLPKPVLDRIHRYAAEGRVLQVSYEEDCCRLLAVMNWQIPPLFYAARKINFQRCAAPLKPSGRAWRGSLPATKAERYRLPNKPYDSAANYRNMVGAQGLEPRTSCV